MQPDLESPWTILQLDPTADARAIKRAYARLLKTIDQATDLAAFQRLHQAFELALGEVRSENHPKAKVIDCIANPDAGSPAAALVPAPTPAEIATHVLQALAVLPAEARIEWLWQEPSLVPQVGRLQVEIAILQQMLGDFPRWWNCFPALAEFFAWSEPLALRSELDVLLFHTWRALEFQCLRADVTTMLQQLVEIEDPDLQLEWLRDHPLLLAGGEHPALTAEVLEQVLLQPTAYAGVLWSLVRRFGWAPPEAGDDSDVGRRLALLFDPGELPLRLCVEGAVQSLLADLGRKTYHADRQALLANDPWLAHRYWGPLLEPALRSWREQHPQGDLARAVEAHFKRPAHRRGPRKARSWTPLNQPVAYLAALVLVKVLAELLR